MFLTHVRHRLKNYAQWRAKFDANTPMLQKAGVLGIWIVPVDGDQTDIVVINTWPSRKNWDDFQAMHNFKDRAAIEAMWKEAGIVGEPVFWSGDVLP